MINRSELVVPDFVLPSKAGRALLHESHPECVVNLMEQVVRNTLRLNEQLSPKIGCLLNPKRESCVLSTTHLMIEFPLQLLLM